jgi:hypothetical protein
MRRILVVAAAALLLSASEPVDARSSASSAAEAARSSMRAMPRIIMFYGGAMKERRYMVDLRENHALMQAISVEGVSRTVDTAERPYVDVAMFWHNPTWEKHATDTALLRTLDPALAQRSRLYLDRGFERAVISSSNAAVVEFREISALGIGIMRINGVPVRR